VELLPQLEQQPLYDRIDVHQGGLWNRNVDDLRWYGDPGKCRDFKESLEVLVCPNEQAKPLGDGYTPVLAATSSYAFVQGSRGPDVPLQIAKFDNNGLFLYVKRRRTSQVVHGLSNTLMLGEVTLSDTWESSNNWSYALVHAHCLRSTANPINTRPGVGEYLVERQNGAFSSPASGRSGFCFRRRAR
jgi:hypothetical protein